MCGTASEIRTSHITGRTIRENLVKFNRLSNGAAIVGLFCFLVLISISELTTNDVSRLFVVPIRNISIAIVICAVVILFSLRKIHFGQLTAAGLYILLVAYGMTLSALNGAF